MEKSALMELLENASAAYYGGKELLLTDDQYDRLYSLTHSDTVGTKPKSGEREHYFQMYSLNKHYENEGNIPSPLDKFVGSKNLIETPKLDGAAIQLTYLNGMFSFACSRGDGKLGQLITDKISSIKNIPPINTVPFKGKNVVQISGEVIVSKDIPNSRNYVSGALNLNSLEEFNSRVQLEFYAYNVQPFVHDTYYDDMYMLHTLGFETVLTVDTDKFKTDGKVLRINNNKLFLDYGYTNHHPKGALAVKVRKSGVYTKLLDVVWQVGKTGRVTPVAILEPVVIDDATVRKATLNNPNFIKHLDLHIGDEVEVVRSGEIIPCIVGKR